MQNIKKSKNKKGKFIELNGKKDNNGLNTGLDNISKQKQQTEYESNLQCLTRLFSGLEIDIIETIYEDNDRNFFLTKKMLEEMTITEDQQLNNKSPFAEEIVDNTTELDGEVHVDINSFVRFRYDDPFIDEKDKEREQKIHKGLNLDEIKKNKLTINPSNVNISLILSQQKKNIDEYQSVLSNVSTNINTNNNTPVDYSHNDNYLEEAIIEYYMDILLEFFPKFSRTEIMEKICEFDFDIDKLVLYLFDSKNESMNNEEFSKLEKDELSEELKEEVLSNFYPKSQNDFNALMKHNLQKKIEKQILKENVMKNVKNNLLNENDFPFISEEVKDEIINNSKAPEEYFLDKEIKNIQSRKIREDLTKLIKMFPLIEEFEIKWVYYQYMDYYDSYRYFCSMTQKTEKNELFNSINNTKKESKNAGYFSSSIKPSNKVNYEVSNDNGLASILCKIISENPHNWQIENSMKDINIDHYQQIRRKLIYQAQLAWQNGCHKDAKVIMARARRYKQDISRLLEKRKVNVFMKNNENNNVVNMINNKENFIDLHGLSYEESKIIIHKKISDVQIRQEKGILDTSTKFALNIITGVGKHSHNKSPVLLPRLSAYFKQNKYFFKVDHIMGIIKVFL